MELHTERAMLLEDDEELAVTQVIAGLRQVSVAREPAESSVGDAADDDLLDQFWRRRSGSGHC